MLIGVSFVKIFLIVVSKHNWEHFISRFSIKQFAPINFLIKLEEVILLFVISVKKLMRPWCVCFVNVRRFLPCRMICSLSFKTKRGIVLTYQIISKYLVWRLRKLSITVPLFFCFYILNFISIDANFRIIPHPFKHIKT